MSVKSNKEKKRKLLTKEVGQVTTAEKKYVYTFILGDVTDRKHAKTYSQYDNA